MSIVRSLPRLEPWQWGVALGGAGLLWWLLSPKKRATSVPSLPSEPSVPDASLGDAFWYWNGRLSRAANIPQQEWFGTTARGDYAGHGDEIYQYVVHEGEVRRGRPHMRGREGSFAWLYNNPGNITGPQPNYGQYPSKYGWHNFLIFPSYARGYEAIGRYLRGGNYRNLSIVDAFRRYAPASDGNDPDRYAADVAQAAGVSPSTLIGELDDAQMRLVQDKIAQIEGTVRGVTLAWDSPELPAAVRAVLPRASV